jgi:hypothetical protein
MPVFSGDEVARLVDDFADRTDRVEVAGSRVFRTRPSDLWSRSDLAAMNRRREAWMRDWQARHASALQVFPTRRAGA